VGIANGYIGYVPTREAYATGGYEVVSSKCQPGAADVLVENVAQLTAQLFGDDTNGTGTTPAVIGTPEKPDDR